MIHIIMFGVEVIIKLAGSAAVQKAALCSLMSLL